MANVKFEDLLSTGAHFGHVTQKWHPNYKPYILMEKNGVHIINLDETLKGLEKAIEFVQDMVRKNGEILFVGTKKQARDIVQQEADRCGMFYVVERWLGGTLTNFSTIKKSIKRLQMLEKEGSSIYENLTKKEIQMLNRERIKLSDQHRGIKDMRRLPDAVVIVDGNHESTAVKEAARLEIPMVAIVDSNTDPEPVAYPIPANDDSIRAVQLIVSALSDGIIEARQGEAKAEAEVETKEAPAKPAAKTEKKPADKDEVKSKKPEKKTAKKSSAKKDTSAKVEKKSTSTGRKKPATKKASSTATEKKTKKPESARSDDKKSGEDKPTESASTGDGQPKEKETTQS